MISTATQQQPVEKTYQVTFILDTRKNSEDVDTLIEKLKKAVLQVQGNITHVENLGRKDFSRVTEKDHTGDFYIVIEFTAFSTAPKALQKNLYLDKTVKRICVYSKR
jgi:small subunit ribosomal protein S6